VEEMDTIEEGKETSSEKLDGYLEFCWVRDIAQPKGLNG